MYIVHTSCVRYPLSYEIKYMEHTQGENPTKQHAMKCPKLYGLECVCDGYHTFDELYEHRFALFIALCRQLREKINADNINGVKMAEISSEIWRSNLHSDGSSFDGWFIVGIGKEKGKQITYHLPLSRWDETNFAETLDHAPDFDGHTSDDVIERLKLL